MGSYLIHLSLFERYTEPPRRVPPCRTDPSCPAAGCPEAAGGGAATGVPGVQEELAPRGSPPAAPGEGAAGEAMKETICPLQTVNVAAALRRNVAIYPWGKVKCGASHGILMVSEQ